MNVLSDAPFRLPPVFSAPPRAVNRRHTPVCKYALRLPAHRDGCVASCSRIIRTGRARASVAGGLSPERVADAVFLALEERRFWVVTHPEYKDEIITRHRQIENAIMGEPASDVELIAMSKAALNLSPLT